MRVYDRHRWDLTYPQARAIQDELRHNVRLKPMDMTRVRYVAGADMAVGRRRAFAAVTVFRLRDLACVETRLADAPLRFPYIPGLLSFREIPVLIRCLRRVRTPFQVLLCDGQGIAHPRRFGLASHLGVLIRRPTVGCAKSRLLGAAAEPGPCKGDLTPLTDGGDRIGTVLRTRAGVKPLFISPGHLIDHDGACQIVLRCITRYRMPEPTRMADRLAGELKRRRPGDV